MEIAIQICGWAGMLVIVWAYYMVSVQKWAPTAKVFQLLNLVGSIGVGVNVFYQKAWPALALEIIWAGIAVRSLIRVKK